MHTLWSLAMYDSLDINWEPQCPVRISLGIRGQNMHTLWSLAMYDSLDIH